MPILKPLLSANEGKHRVTIVIAAILALVFASTPTKANSALSVSDARAQFAVCIESKVVKYSSYGELTSSGLAFFVGAACAPERDVYQQALVAAGIPKTPQLMDQIDSVVVAFIVISNPHTPN